MSLNTRFGIGSSRLQLCSETRCSTSRYFPSGSGISTELLAGKWPYSGPFPCSQVRFSPIIFFFFYESLFYYTCLCWNCSSICSTLFERDYLHPSACVPARRPTRRKVRQWMGLPIISCVGQVRFSPQFIHLKYRKFPMLFFVCSQYLLNCVCLFCFFSPPA